ncbi:MAG: phosphoribulokinase [Gammaproteobacteria bacterium]|nr:phosphoribulokinase [Gammaproteobacteria bacterium]
MSKKHPIVAVTGSSGAGTSSVRVAFEHVFHRENIQAAFVAGDSFHYYNREEMRVAIRKAHAANKNLSHFGPEGNLFKKLESLFKSYGETGAGTIRHYLHDDKEALRFVPQKPGEFTPWANMPEGSDLLLYEGLHGGVVTDEVDVAQHVDLLIGVTPTVNLEWIQKIHRDSEQRGYTTEDSVATILRRMNDYVRYITPQFSRTDINFQRVPTVDTSNPFIARDVPTLDESLVVIRFDQPEKFEVSFPYLLQMIDNSFMSRRNTIVIPGPKLIFAMELIFTPTIKRLVDQARALK